MLIDPATQGVPLMTPLQYERWKDFSLRMARICFTRNRRPSAAWIIKQVERWFYWRDFQEDWDRYNSWDQDAHPLCDHVTEFYDNERASAGLCKACAHDCQSGWLDCEQHCPLCDLECTCRERDELCYEQFDEQWLGPVRCCLRAGIDMVCQPSTGVLGFRAGDIRAMYPEGVPDWLFPPGERFHYWLSDEVNGTFEELPDSTNLVL